MAFFHRSISVTRHSSLITHHLKYHTPFGTITQYFSHCMWAPFLALGWSKAILLPTTGFHPHQPPLFSFPLTSPLIKYHTNFGKGKKKKKKKPGPKCMKNKAAQQTFLTFSHLSLPLHLRSKPTTATSQIQTSQPHLKSELHAHKSNQKLKITTKIPYQPRHCRLA